MSDELKAIELADISQMTDAEIDDYAKSLYTKLAGEPVDKTATPVERLKSAMNKKPMKSMDAAEAYLKIASMCKAFDEMPMPIQSYITATEEEFGYQPPESVV